jgi:Flp pilus assembly protein TadB
MVIVIMMYNLWIGIVLQVAGAIVLMLTVVRRQRSAERKQRYEQEVAQAMALYAAARAAGRRYRRT